jgi:hypothetical protein
VNGKYESLRGEPVWLEELGLGLGREVGSYLGVEREWLYWYDGTGNRYLSPEERIVEGHREGRLEGHREGKLELIFRVVEQKFGGIPEDLAGKIRRLAPDRLDELAISLLVFSGIAELENWLNRETA